MPLVLGQVATGDPARGRLPVVEVDVPHDDGLPRALGRREEAIAGGVREQLPARLEVGGGDVGIRGVGADRQRFSERLTRRRVVEANDGELPAGYAGSP